MREQIDVKQAHRESKSQLLLRHGRQRAVASRALFSLVGGSSESGWEDGRCACQILPT